MKRPKFPPADTYALLSECVERGVAFGLRRAHKHTDKPTSEQIEEAVSSAVMGEIAEAFVFPERGECPLAVGATIGEQFRPYGDGEQLAWAAK